MSRRTPQGSPASFPNPPRSPWGPPEVPRAPEMRFPSTLRIPKQRFCVESMSKWSVSLVRNANHQKSRHAILTNSPREIDVSEALGQIGQARGAPLWEHFGVKFLSFFVCFHQIFNAFLVPTWCSLRSIWKAILTSKSIKNRVAFW